MEYTVKINYIVASELAQMNIPAYLALWLSNIQRYYSIWMKGSQWIIDETKREKKLREWTPYENKSK